MKNGNRRRSLGIALFMVLLTTACANTGTITKSATETGIAGQAASKAAVSVLEDIAGLSEKEFETDRVKALLYARSDMPPANVWKTYHAVPKSNHGQALAPYIAEYKSVAATYKLFHKLATTGTAEDTQKAVVEWTRAWHALTPDDPAIPESVSTVLGSLAGQWQANSIQKHNLLLAALSKKAIQKWNMVAPVLNTHINRSHDHQRNMYTGLPDRVLGKTDIAVANLEGPWIPVIKTRLYFHRKLVTIEASRQKMLANTDNVGKAFGKLQKAHMQLAQEKPSAIAITNFIEEILDMTRDMRNRSTGAAQ